MTRPGSVVRALGFCTVLLAACSNDPAMPPPPHPEEADIAGRDALIALYNATDGANWHDRTNWLTSERISFWHGVSTNSAGFVTELSLTGNNLSGTLPPELGDLAQLRRLVLNDNELTGPIPPELGKLSRLTMLRLSENSLNGTIPAELAELPRLDTLLLWRNELSGPIPAELGSMGSLQRLLLAWNQLSGPVPPELGNLPRLAYLSLSRNELTGTIPPEPRRYDYISLFHKGLA